MVDGLPASQNAGLQNEHNGVPNIAGIQCFKAGNRPKCAQKTTFSAHIAQKVGVFAFSGQ